MKKILAFTLACLMLAVSFVSCSKYETKFGKSFTPIDKQVDVLYQLNAGNIDVGVMDSIMAGYYMSVDSTYSNNLMIVPNLVLAEEEYGIAARKGSGFAKVLSAALVALNTNGTVKTIADKYGLASEICIDAAALAALGDLTAEEQADIDYIKSQGKFIVGYTLFAPIAFMDENNNLVGFDIELAKAAAALLVVEVEFKEIYWDTKEAELESKKIDCIWNGMTITEERKANMAVTIPYMKNKQVAVIRKADKDLYTTTESMAKAIIGAEKGSAGMDCVVKEKD